MFCDLQLSRLLIGILMLFTDVCCDVLTSGHWRQFVVLHFWFSNNLSSMLSDLFCMKLLPIDGFFFTAITILVSPITWLRSSDASWRIFLNDDNSVRCTSSVSCHFNVDQRGIWSPFGGLFYSIWKCYIQVLRAQRVGVHLARTHLRFFDVFL